MTSRRDELAAALGATGQRIADAARAAGRDPDEITLVAVTKTFPVEDARLLMELGVHDLGENRDQEAKVKAQALPDAHWHFVGQLQTNKARSVTRYASAVHSVDRIELVDALARARQNADRGVLDVFVQVDLQDGPSGGRGGIAPAELLTLAAAVVEAPILRLRGVMAVAPLDGDPAAAFARLAGLSEQLRAEHPDATSISAGMSADLDVAIKFGATHVRVGSALLGHRTVAVG